MADKMRTNDRHIVFVGGGHAHLYSLKRLAALMSRGARITVVAPSEWHYYSGMAPGILAGTYTPEQARFNVKAMAEKAGARFVQASVTGISPVDRTLTLSNGNTIEYDAVSFNVGSTVPAVIPGSESPHLFPVKPIERVIILRQRIIDLCSDGRANILVIGGGAAGVELAGNVRLLVNRVGGSADIKLLTADNEILPDLPDRARKIAVHSLTNRGIEIISDSTVAGFGGDKASLANGREITFDVAVLAVGIKPVSPFAPGVQTAADGSMLVNEYLQSTAYDNIYGGGDCITFSPGPLKRVGVFAVRQAPVIFANLSSWLAGNTPKPFRPQKKYVSILNLGDGTGLLVRENRVAHGAWAWIYKEFLDKSFAAKYQ